MLAVQARAASTYWGKSVSIRQLRSPRAFQTDAPVHSAQRLRPRVARKRLRQYQRRAIACSGLRTNWAIKRISTIVNTCRPHDR